MKTILCFGDSNTHGTMPLRHLGDERRLGPSERWPGAMAALLGEGYRVIEEGHPGRTTVFADPIEGAHKSGLAVLPALLETHRPIDIVVTMLGTNDLKARFGLPAGDIAAGMARLVETILQSAAGPSGAAPAVIVVAPPPIRATGCLVEMFAGGFEKAPLLAEKYRATIAAAGVSHLDGGSVATMSDQEGIHMDAEGHLALGAAIASAVLGGA